MSKILVTGMTASQFSPGASKRALSFAGILVDQLQKSGHEVDWMPPQTSWNILGLDQYDSVLVGIAPVLSLAASATYGALSVIDLLWETGKLTFFIDAPLPSLIMTSLRHVKRNPKSLVKPLFNARPGYSSLHTAEVIERVYRSAYRLEDKPWPTTLYPALPWSNEDVDCLPAHMVGLNFDREYINPLPATLHPQELGWVADVKTSKWLDKVKATTTQPVWQMKNNKSSTDGSVRDTMRTSTGALISPQRTGRLWWSTRFAQALETGTPIASEWRETSVLGPSWGLLATEIEALTPQQRLDTSKQQQIDYIQALPSLEFSRRTFEHTLGLAYQKEN